jgi:hypothetical protein
LRGKTRAQPRDAVGVNNKKHRRASARGQSIPASLQGILESFAGCFTRPSLEDFVALVSGWILCPGRHSISRVIQLAGGPAREKHFSALYRFLSRARWFADDVGRVLFGLLLPWLPGDIEALVDDTLCHRSGPHIFGAGMHHDASRSTYGRGTAAGRHVSFAFGQSWVVLALRVPLPWDRRRGIAVPILFRLYRPKRRSPEGQYRKRTELALELVKLLESWIPSSSRLYAVADAEYACRTLVRGMAESTTFVGPMAMNAALYEPAGTYPGLGRPRKMGRRLCSPRQLADDSSTPWKRATIRVYGRKVKVQVKTLTCLWYTVAGTRVVKLVVTRDPKKRIEDRAYFSTDPDTSAEALLERFSLRWMIEVSFRDAKQHLGLEDPQNGWGRRKKGARRRRKRPGPQARGKRGETATLHTVPLAFVAYAVVVIWYLQHGQKEYDLRRARRRMPWYRSKATPSFCDMLVAIRRETWARRLSDSPHEDRDRGKLRYLLSDALLAA